MKTSTSNLEGIGIRIFIFISSLIIIFTFFFHRDIDANTLINAVSFSITLTSILLVLIEKFFWKNILLFFSNYPFIWPFVEKYEVPILKENYNCLIEYEWQGSRKEKQVHIEVNQTYTSISITLITDEIRSDSIISEITKQDNNFILFYIYKTSPKAKFHKNNPPQLGGGKIVLDSLTKIDSNDKLSGKYWTTSQTSGDMELFSVNETHEIK